MREILLSTPALHNASKEYLFRIIGNICPKTIDCVTKIPIREESYLGDFYKGLEWGKDFRQQCVDKLTMKFLKRYVICIFLGC